MKYNQFEVFEKDNKFRLSANMVVYSIFGLTLPTAYFSDKYLGDSLLEQIGLFGFFISFILGVFLKIIQLGNRKTLQGKLSGLIEFNYSNIRINDSIFNLKDIQKIELEIGDYLDRREFAGKGEFNPTLSTGTDNRCCLKLSNRTQIETYFQIKAKNDFKKLRAELIEYYQQGKLTWLRLIDLLGIDKYEEIQDFKKTLMPTMPKKT